MKYLSLISFFFALCLFSCHKEESEPSEDAPVVAMLEVRSNVKIPKNVTRIRLTELQNNIFTEMIPEANRPDTTKAVLSLSYKKVPKKFDALVTTEFKDGKIFNNKIKDIQLEKGIKTSFIGNIFSSSFSIGYDDKPLDSVIIEF